MALPSQTLQGATARRQPAPVVIRPAVADDVQAIAALIEPFAERDIMLPRTPAYIFELLDRFLVAEEAGEPVGCVGLRPMGQDRRGRRLVEIISLAVSARWQGRGVGRELVEAALQRARAEGWHSVFTLTLAPDFFRRLGFGEVDNLFQRFPFKIWRECIYCSKQSRCDEVALWIDLQTANDE